MKFLSYVSGHDDSCPKELQRSWQTWLNWLQCQKNKMSALLQAGLCCMPTITGPYNTGNWRIPLILLFPLLTTPESFFGPPNAQCLLKKGGFSNSTSFFQKQNLLSESGRHRCTVVVVMHLPYTHVCVAKFSNSLRVIVRMFSARHPVLWFSSFWKMRDKETPNELTGICPCNVDARGRRRGKSECRSCRLSCPKRQLYCVGRARFHLPLARLGKTTLSEEERLFLAPHDFDGGKFLVNFNISNPIFLYDQTELREGYLWKELSEYLGVSHIPHRKFKGSVGHGRNYTLCDPLYDDFRSRLMPYSYDLSTWLQRYFLPVANNPSRPDVRVADVERLTTVVRSYTQDPCKRLVRTENGTYVLNYTLGSTTPVST